MDILVKIAITAPDGVVHEHVIAAFEKGPTIACKLRLAVNVLGVSYRGNLYRTLH